MWRDYKAGAEWPKKFDLKLAPATGQKRKGGLEVPAFMLRDLGALVTM